MNQKKYESWKREEQEPFSGWDFAYLEGRLLEEDAPPGNYMSMARELLVGSAAALDMEQGAVSALPSLAHFRHVSLQRKGIRPISRNPRRG